jgi:hypothetical protein
MLLPAEVEKRIRQKKVLLGLAPWEPPAAN